MVQASEIKDREALRRWLEGRPQEDAVAIAHRAALRVFPVWAAAMEHKWTREHDLTALPVLRPILSSGVCVSFPIPEVESATSTARAAAERAARAAAAQVSAQVAAAEATAAGAAAANAADVAYFAAAAFVDAAYPAQAAAGDAAIAARAATAASATEAADASTTGAAEAAEAAAASAYATKTAETAEAAAVIWKSVRDDAQAIERGQNVFALPLWSDTPLLDFFTLEQSFQSLWSRDPDTWDFWRRWWEGARDGRPLDWELQKRVALIPSEEWEKNDPAHIARLIRQIEAEWKAEQQARAGDNLQRALARTENAERVEVNPETGLLRLVPTSALPADIAALARINIAAALDLFGPRPQDQYRALDPVRARLRGVLTQAPDMPLVLFDACRSGVLITQGYVGTQSIPEPEKDPLIAEFLRILRETALDIVNNDPRTREVLDQRRQERDASALFEVRDETVSLSDAAAEQSEGELAVALPEDARSALTLDVEPELRRDSTYRLVGRLLRVGIVTGVKGLSVVSGAYAGWEVVIKGLTYLAQRPEWQMFLKAAWRFLGLG